MLTKGIVQEGVCAASIILGSEGRTARNHFSNTMLSRISCSVCISLAGGWRPLWSECNSLCSTAPTTSARDECRRPRRLNSRPEEHGRRTRILGGGGYSTARPAAHCRLPIGRAQRQKSEPTRRFSPLSTVDGYTCTASRSGVG